jgi:anti-sigma factor RsiW
MNEHMLEKMSAYLDGQLSPSATAQATAHIETCDACRAEANRLRALKGRLAGLDRHPAPVALMRSLNHAFVDAPAPRLSLWWNVFTSFMWRPAGAIAATVAIAGLIALGINVEQSRPGMDVDALIAAHMRYEAESLVPNADPAHAHMSAQLVKYYADED